MSPEPTSRRIPYQPALDGLRGVAVAAVLLYHGSVSWARGGFLGVDVFFVLSGYLITSLLVAEWREHDTIDLRAFWLRRARRLLPALFLVLVAVAVYAAIVVPPDQLGRVRGDGLAGLFYVANWHLIVTGHSYFDQFSDPSPLNHLWSLGIEEQWYLLWPPLVAIGLRLRSGRVRSLAVGALVAAAASAVLMALLVHGDTDPSRAYFGTDTRAQSLLVGAALAFLLGRPGAKADNGDGGDDDGDGGGGDGKAVRTKTRPRKATVAQALGLAGAGVLAVMFVAADGRSLRLYRGGFALVALATAAVIWAAVQPDGPLRRALSHPTAVWVGRISYGLYLWHWPIYVALTPDRVGLAGFRLLTLRIATTVVAAALSFRFVETPIRTRRWLGRSQWRFLGAAACAATVVAALLVVSTLGAEPTLPVAAGPGGASGGARPPGRSVPPGSRPVPSPSRVRILLVGDSVAFSLGYSYRAGLVPGAVVRSGALIGCGVARGRHIMGGKLTLPNPRCADWPARWNQAVQSFDPDVTVIMIGAWEVFDRKVGDRVLRVGTPEYAAYLDTEMETALGVVASRGAPVAVLNVPCYREPDRQLGEPPSERNDPRRVAWLNQVLKAVVARHTNRLRLVDVAGYLCPGGRYVDKIDGVKVRRDGVHFTPEGAQLVWRWLGRRLVDLATHPGG